MERFVATLIDGLNRAGRNFNYPGLVRNAIELRKREVYESFSRYLSGNTVGLDIGAGDGTLATVNNGCNIISLDINPITHSNPNTPFIKSDAHSLPFNDSSFDYVTMIYSLHHLSIPTLGLQEASRVLKTGGIFVAMEEHCRYPGHKWIMAVNDRVAERTIFSSEKSYSENTSYFTSKELGELLKVFSLDILEKKYFPPNRPLDIFYKSAKYLYISKKV
jgi:SAM-dependent methyltransferase